MIDFNKLKGKVAVHLPTQEQFNEFLKECDKKGITWVSGEKATNNQSYWSIFKEMTSVCICDKSYIVCGTIDNFTFFHYTILEYSDVCNSDLPRICYILGGEDSPLQIDEEFQVIGDNGIYYIDQNGHFIDEFECGNEHGLCDAINHPENVIRNPMNKQFTDEQKSLLKSLLTFGLNFVARDKSGEICAFYKKPYKNATYWDVEGGKYLRLPDELFPQITWEDNEPFDIKAYFESEANNNE